MTIDDAPTTLHRAPLVLPVCSEPIHDGAVAVRAGRVVWIGPADEYRAADPTHPAHEVRDWPGLLMPGLVNAHTHLQYTDFADLATGRLAFHDWLSRLSKRRGTFSDEQWQDSARRGVQEVLRAGTTCVADIISDPCVLPTLAASGLAGIGYVEVVAADSAAWIAHRRDRLLDTLDGPGGPSGPGGTDGSHGSHGSHISAGGPPPRLGVGISPHTAYTIGTEVFAECVRAARERGLRLHPHLAETVAEAEFVLSGTGPFADIARNVGWTMELVRDGGCGRSPAAYVRSLDGLGGDVHVAHGVHLGAEDRALLRSMGTAVALCPRSNALLQAGEPPVAAYRAEGSPVAVGTDSRASVPSLDLLADLAALREIALRQGSPPDGLDRWLVEAATLGGARALRLDVGDGAVGALRVGGAADLAVFDVPVDGDPYRALVGHGPGRCVGTVLAGTVVYDGTARSGTCVPEAFDGGVAQ